MPQRGRSGPPAKGRLANRPKPRKVSTAAPSIADLQKQVGTLTRELKEANERQTATAEVLQVINSSPGDLVPVFDAMLENATLLCEASHCNVFRFDGVQLHAVAIRGDPWFTKWLQEHSPISPIPGSAADRIARGEDIVHVADRREEVAYSSDPLFRELVDSSGVRASLSVALRRDGTLLGMINVYRQEVRPFSDKQIALLQNFAAQAVIAMENARLVAETREALERQTATAEVLQIINASPGDLKPVFDAMLDKAMRLCEASFGGLAVPDGELARWVASRGVPEAFDDWLAHQKFRLSSLLGPSFRDRSLLHVLDVKETEGYRKRVPSIVATVELGGARTCLLVPLVKDDALVGVIVLYRQEARAFSDKQIALLENFAAQAVIAIENARLLTETREALERQTATAEVLQVINSSPGDLTPVFDAILEKAHSLCGVSHGSLQLYDGEKFRAVAVHGISEAFADRLRQGFVPGPNHPSQPLLKGARFTQVPDCAGAYDPLVRAAFELAGIRTVLFIPLRKDGSPLGQIAAARPEAMPFTEKEIALLENFAAQAVIAIENARLLGELRERTADLARSVDELTATGDVLKIISRSSVDLDTVLDTLVETVARLCRSDQAVMFRRLDERYHVVASCGLPNEAKDFLLSHPLAANRSTLSGRVELERRPIQIGDVLQDPEYAYLEGQRIQGYRTMLGVPLLRQDSFVGIFIINRTRVEPFTDKEIELASTFADQAVIAIENARLFEELRQSLQQQTSTADVLKVIGRSAFDLGSVLQTLVESAARLCEADKATITRQTGEVFYRAEFCGFSDEFMDHLRRIPIKPERGSASGRALLEKQAIHILDVLSDPEYTLVEEANWGGFRTALAVPILREGVPIGVLSLTRSEMRPFTDKQIELVSTFADQAAIAIENARLVAELRERQAELRVTFDNMGDGVVMFDAAGRLAAWNRNLQEMIELPEAFLAGRPNRTEYFRYLADRGEFSADLEAQLGRTVDDTGLEMWYERTRPDGRVVEVRRNPVPGGGFVLIYSDITQRKRAEEAIRAARDAAETALHELQMAQASLVHAQKMAALGQVTAGIAHEIKNPLNFVNNFAGLSVELLDKLKEAAALSTGTLDPAKRAEILETIRTVTGNLEKIVEHGRRADGIVRSMLQHSRGGSGDWQATDLNAVVEETLNLAYHGARAQDQSFEITLERDLDRDLGPVDVVPQEITRVLLNLIGNGFYAANKRSHEGDGTFRPALKVTTRGSGESVEVRVRDNGIGIPLEDRDKLFQPFFTTKPTGEGTGLGLSISYEIVTQQHGGSITVDSEVGDFTEFTVRLPRRSRAAG